MFVFLLLPALEGKLLSVLLHLAAYRASCIKMGGETSRVQRMVDEEFQNTASKKVSAASSSEIVSRTW